MADSYDVWTRRTWNLTLVKPTDGGLIQRWPLPALGLAAAADIAPHRADFLTGAGHWRLAPLAQKADP